MDPYSKVLMDFLRLNPTSYNSIRNTQITPVTLGALKPSDAIALQTMKALPLLQKLLTNFLSGVGGIATLFAADKLSNTLFGDSELGRNLGNMFSTGLGASGNRLFSNIIKGDSLLSGLKVDAASSIGGAAAGLAANYLGKGITALGGDTALSRGIGQGVATGLGTVGGLMVSNLIKGKGAVNMVTDSIKAIKAAKAAGEGATNAMKLASTMGTLNLAGLGGSVVGTALSAALGPSKEYGGKYGNVTQTLDTAYDGIAGVAGFMGPIGMGVSGAMALNKGLSNIFGSTSGMTLQDSILGSAFMPAPVKWLNMAGARTTGTFNNQSWQNTEKTNSFMQNAFGNLGDRFDQAREEAGKTYGLFSRGAYNDALGNLNFANKAWNQILDMADLNRLQTIRSTDMASINNLRYALDIQGGWNPIYRGKQGMKILNGDFNHNIGMRLLSAAALIDNKLMILTNYN